VAHRPPGAPPRPGRRVSYPGTTSCFQKLERGLTANWGTVEIAIEADYRQTVLLGSQVLVSIIEVKVEALRDLQQPWHVSGVQAHQTNGPLYEYVLHESRKRLETVKPVQHDSDRMQREIGNEETIRCRILQKPAHLLGPRLIEKSLQPNVGVYEVHQLVTPPFQRPLLKLQGGILVPVVPESACPVLAEFSPRLLPPPLDQELCKVSHLLTEVGRQLPDKLFDAVHGSLRSRVLPQTSIHSAANAWTDEAVFAKRAIAFGPIIPHSGLPGNHHLSVPCPFASVTPVTRPSWLKHCTYEIMGSPHRLASSTDARKDGQA
jgi:hypothetical protein